MNIIDYLSLCKGNVPQGSYLLEHCTPYNNALEGYKVIIHKENLDKLLMNTPVEEERTALQLAIESGEGSIEILYLFDITDMPESLTEFLLNELGGEDRLLQHFGFFSGNSNLDYIQDDEMEYNNDPFNSYSYANPPQNQPNTNTHFGTNSNQYNTQPPHNDPFQELNNTNLNRASHYNTAGNENYNQQHPPNESTHMSEFGVDTNMNHIAHNNHTDNYEMDRKNIYQQDIGSANSRHFNSVNQTPRSEIKTKKMDMFGHNNTQSLNSVDIDISPMSDSNYDYTDRNDTHSAHQTMITLNDGLPSELEHKTDNKSEGINEHKNMQNEFNNDYISVEDFNDLKISVMVLKEIIKTKLCLPNDEFESLYESTAKKVKQSLKPYLDEDEFQEKIRILLEANVITSIERDFYIKQYNVNNREELSHIVLSRMENLGGDY